MPPLSLRILCTAAGLLMVLSNVAAEDVPAPRDLVRRLGDPSFTERDRASGAIMRLGRSAVAALQEGLKDPDAEVRRRSAELLPLARRSDLDVRLDAFIAGSEESSAPFPGWLRFRQLAGKDPSARWLFVAIGRSDLPLLETLEKDSSRVGSQLAERCRKTGGRPGVRLGVDSSGTDAEMAGLLLAAACSSDKSSTASNQFMSYLYGDRMRSFCRENLAARHLLAKFLGRQLEEPWRLHQTVWIARTLGLDEFIESTLKPEARKLATAAAARPDDSGNLSQAASMATMLGLHDTIETLLKPAARLLAEKTAERPDDPGRVYQTLNLLQTLNMQNTINSTLRPAAFMTIASVAEKPYDQYRFQMALNLARTLQLKEPIDQVLKPAAVKALISLAQQIQQNPAQMHAALNLVQTFDLKEASEDFLKPAARRLAEAAARSSDPGKLAQAAEFITSLGVSDGSAESLRGAVRKLAADSTADINRINELVTVAQSLGMTETIDTTLKAQARRALLAAKDRPVSQNVQQVLQLARTMQLKEGVPFALKAAREKRINAWSRGIAILFVADFGGKEHIPEMESLLNDSASLGAMGINFSAIPTEVRDVALAAMVVLSGDSLNDYGFWYVKLFGGGKGPLSSLSAQCYGFADTNAREAAVKKWRERSKPKK
jgi:hypothetical protein